MAEWSNAAVLKTVDLNGSGGSNPSLSAKKWLTGNCEPLFVYGALSKKCTLSFGVIVQFPVGEIASFFLIYRHL